MAIIVNSERRFDNTRRGIIARGRSRQVGKPPYLPRNDCAAASDDFPIRYEMLTKSKSFSATGVNIAEGSFSTG